MATHTIGANLHPVLSSKEARDLSIALEVFIEKLNLINGATVTFYGKRAHTRVFTKDGAPATNTSADSPGQDLCFVIDTSANDLYLIYDWSAADTFKALKILEATAT